MAPNERQIDQVELRFNDDLVGIARHVFSSDSTWYGSFVISNVRVTSKQMSRIDEFISFCEDWNERVTLDGADASEFDDYRDIVRTGRWEVVYPDGSIVRVLDAPVFFRGGDVSWLLADTAS